MFMSMRQARLVRLENRMWRAIRRFPDALRQTIAQRFYHWATYKM